MKKTNLFLGVLAGAVLIATPTLAQRGGATGATGSVETPGAAGSTGTTGTTGSVDTMGNTGTTGTTTTGTSDPMSTTTGTNSETMGTTTGTTGVTGSSEIDSGVDATTADPADPMSGMRGASSGVQAGADDVAYENRDQYGDQLENRLERVDMQMNALPQAEQERITRMRERVRQDLDRLNSVQEDEWNQFRSNLDSNMGQLERQVQGRGGLS